jgi:hypothetical protein
MACNRSAWEYLRRRENILRQFHPQWMYTDADIDNSNDVLKRQKTPICIPPSWDLVKKYTGPMVDKQTTTTPDGYDELIFKYDEGEINGDRGEERFLLAAQSQHVGGIMIGNIDSSHLLFGKHLPEDEKITHGFIMPRSLSKIVDDGKVLANFKFEALEFLNRAA